MKFIENILTDKVVERIKRIFLQDEFAWSYNSGTSKIRPGDNSALIDNNTKESIQFSHSLYTDGSFGSEHVDFVMKIMKALEEQEGIVCTTMLKAKCNLLPQDSSFLPSEYHPPHIDSRDVSNNTYTLVYYVNDSDGDTIVFNESVFDEFENLTIAHRQTPRAGCGLLFKSSTYHASSSPLTNSSRIVINIVFESDETKRRENILL